jgi:hypothetical protein
MAIYRAYFLTVSDHINAAPALLDCASDEEAIQEAKQFLNGRGIELWEGARLVAQLRSNDLG